MLHRPELGIEYGVYHGKKEVEERTQIQNEFMNDLYDVVICTKAFGMGIDKDNVKYTIHTALPQSVESFYQEAGRAGREKDKSVISNCYIIYEPELVDVERIFRLDTSVDERKLYSSDFNNDLNTIMFFWNNNRKNLDEEYENIRKVLVDLYIEKNRNLPFYSEHQLSDIQSALYKLFILGIIDNWTINYFTVVTGKIVVEYNGIDEECILRKLYEYIHKYDVEFQIEKESERYKKYYEIASSEDKAVTKYIKILIEWANDNIIYNRLQSTYTMLQWMNLNISDETFRQNFVEYFKFSEESIIFESIIYNPTNFENWFDLLYILDDKTRRRIAVIDKEEAGKLLAKLQRYLESYRNNTGFNYLSGMARLLTGNYSGTEGEWRFREALNNMKTSMSIKDRNQVIKYSLKIAKGMSIESKDYLSRELITVFEGYEEKIFDEINDRYSLSVLLQEPAQRIQKIVEGF